MRTCPHCQFLVPDGATECTVCHQTLAAVPDPGAVPVGAAAPFAAPGDSRLTATTTPPPFAPPQFGGHPGVPLPPGASLPPGAPFHGPPPRPSGVSTKVIVSAVLAVGVLGVLGIGALFLVGTTADLTAKARTELRSDDLDWQTYDDSAGRFTVELPGTPREDSVELDVAYGTTAEMEGVLVADPRFNASVSVMADAVLAGEDFSTIPFSPAGAEQGVSQLGFDDAELLTHEIVGGTDDTAIDMVMAGTVGGDDAVMLARLVIVGSDLYEINVVGSVDDRDELELIHERLAASFRQT